MFDRLIHGAKALFQRPPTPINDECERLAAIRRKAESAEAANAARRFLMEPSIRQVMPSFDGQEL